MPLPFLRAQITTVTVITVSDMQYTQGLLRRFLWASFLQSLHLKDCEGKRVLTMASLSTAITLLFMMFIRILRNFGPFSHRLLSGH